MERLIVSAQRWKIRRQFLAKLGYAGDFDNPKTYQEKIQYRKLYGNHPFYAMAADKYRVRDYVAAKAGAKYLIPLLGAYDRLRASDFDTLPPQFIIKANHGCKWNRLVLDKSALDIKATIRWFNTLCHRRYGWAACERHYNFIRPKIVIEQLMQVDGGGLPWDYNFYCYNGPDGFDYDYGVGSPTGSNAGASIAKDGELLYNIRMTEQELAAHAKPDNLDEMVALARALSADFDFVRVDLYNFAGQVYFGELTCTPRQGYGKIDNERVQQRRNEMWHLDVDNPRLYVKRTRSAASAEPLISPASTG